MEGRSNLNAVGPHGPGAPGAPGASAQDDKERALGGARRAPRALFNRAATVLAERWLADLREHENEAVSTVRAVLARLPSSLADALAWSLVTRLARQQKHRREGRDAEDADGGLPVLLVDVLAASASSVDFSPLSRLQGGAAVNPAAFCSRLAGALPRLGQLTRLTLTTHGQRVAYPACSDRVLAAVARCCPELRFLDVAFNRGVSATGLGALCEGCPLLEELLVGDCVLPASALVALLQRLPLLRVLGHQEVGTAVRLLHTGYRWLRDGVEADDDGPEEEEDAASAPALRLSQVVNLGEASVHRSRPADEASRLRCSAALVRVLRALCPALEELRVRVLDADVPHLAALRGVHTLELRFHAAARPSSLGPHTVRFLGLHGARLTALTAYSASLRASHFAAVGRHCPNLTLLWMRCNQLVLDEDAADAADAATTRPFSRLENLSVRVGFDHTSVCRFPDAFLRGLLRHARALQKLYVAVNSADVADAWLQRVLEACPAEALLSLRTLFLLLPQTNEAHPLGPRLDLGPASVALVRARCPGLRELGNLLVWNLQQEEVRHLQQRLRASNCVLRLVSKATVWR